MKVQLTLSRWWYIHLFTLVTIYYKTRTKSKVFHGKSPPHVSTQTSSNNCNFMAIMLLLMSASSGSHSEGVKSI